MKKKPTFYKNISLFFLGLIFCSCSSNLDFKQAEDIVIKPVIVANLTNFEIPAPDFLTNGGERTLTPYALDFDAFKDEFSQKNVTKVNLSFEITNTISRPYILKLFFIDELNQPVYIIDFPLVPKFIDTPQIITKTQVIQGTDLDNLKKTTKIFFNLTMLNGTPPLTESSPGSLKLKSSGTVYLEIK